MTTKAFQKIYTKIDNITKATVTVRAQGVGNDELATVGGKLAQVVRISGDDITLQVFQERRVSPPMRRWFSTASRRC